MIHGNSAKPSSNNSCYSDGLMPPEVSAIGYRNSNGIPMKQPNLEVVDKIHHHQQPLKDNFLSPNHTSPETPEGSEMNKNLVVIENNSQNMVPMTMVLKRHLGRALVERRELLDVLPTLRRTERKRRILNFVTNNKKRITKLIILMKWARNATKIQEAHNVIGYLQKQNRKFTRACVSLHFIGTSLRKDRMEAYDVLSAIDVFSTGTYGHMPAIVKERYIPAQKIQPEQVTSTLDLLNDIIFQRYLKVEGIPDVLKKGIRIENGKFYLTLHKRYEVVLTLLGPDQELPWHLVAIKVFIAGESPDTEPGQESIFTLAQYQRIMYIAQQKLLPSHLRDETQNNNEANSRLPEGLAEILPGSPETKTPYIGYLNDYLQNFCASLQLEILHGQAASLAGHRWKDQLKIEMNGDHSCLKLSYWSKYLPLSFDQTSAILDKEKSHYLSILKPEGSELTLKAEWLGSTVVSLVSKLRKEDLASISAKEKELVFDPTRLNVEKVLRKMIRLHSKIILLRLRSLLLASRQKSGISAFSNALFSSDVVLVDTESPSLMLQYNQNRRLRLTVDFRSGRLNVYMDNEQGGELRLGELEKELNDRPAEVEQILQEWKLKRIVDNIRFMAVFNGLEATAKLPLSSADLNKFGTVIQKAIFMRLPNISDSYLVVALVANCLNFWLVALSDGPEGRSIAHMTPLSKDLTQLAKGFDGLLQGEGDDLLGKLLKLCEGHHLANTVEKQLIGIADFKQTPPFSSGVVTAPPCLLSQTALAKTGVVSPLELEQFRGVQLAQLFSISSESLNAPISAATPFVAGPVAMYAAPALGRWVAFSCLLYKHRLPGQPDQLPSHWVLESAGDCEWLTFMYVDFEGCVEQFQLDWLSFVVATKLYIGIGSLLDELQMSVSGYDMQSVSISYHEHYWITVGFAEGRLAIALHSRHPQGYWNPHLRIHPFLESDFNESFSLYKLLSLLKYTLPLLLELDEFERRMTRPFNLVPLSCTNFRLVFSVQTSLDIELLSPTQVSIQDGFSPDFRPLPMPWRPASRPPMNHLSIAYRPALNSNMALYTTHLPFISKRFEEKRDRTFEFHVTNSSVVIDISLVLAALQSYDWLCNMVTLFQRAHTFFKDPNRPATPTPVFKRVEDFDLSYTTPTCTWALRVKEGLSAIVLEPVNFTATNGPLTREDMSTLSLFLESKINIIGQSQAGLLCAHVVTHFPAPVLHDFAEVIRFIESPSSKDGGFSENIKVEWHLSVPHRGQFNHPSLPKMGQSVFSYNTQDSTIKALFSIKRGDVFLTLPLQFHTERRTLSIWNSFGKDPAENIPIVQRPALSNLVQRADRDLPLDGSRIAGLLEQLCRLPIDDFRFAAA